MKARRIDGTKLRHTRELAGLHQEDLAEKIGVDRSAVAYWESETYQPGPPNFRALCRILRVRQADLLAVDDDQAA